MNFTKIMLQFHVNIHKLHVKLTARFLFFVKVVKC